MSCKIRLRQGLPEPTCTDASKRSTAIGTQRDGFVQQPCLQFRESEGFPDQWDELRVRAVLVLFISASPINSLNSHERASSNATSTITPSSSPNPKQHPFSPTSALATVSDTSTDEPSGSISNEKAAVGSSTTPARPEPAHADPSRLARFLANAQISGPYNGIHATSLFSGVQRQPLTRTDTGMQVSEPRRDYS